MMTCGAGGIPISIHPSVLRKWVFLSHVVLKWVYSAHSSTSSANFPSVNHSSSLQDFITSTALGAWVETVVTPQYYICVDFGAVQEHT